MQSRIPIHQVSSSLAVSLLNIRSTSKNLDKLKERMRIANHEYTIISISDTHFKGTALEFYNLPGCKTEFGYRINRKKGMCVYTLQIKLSIKQGKDLRVANSNYESCFIEIERENAKKALVGIVYTCRDHTCKNGFILDIDKLLFNKTNLENKITCMWTTSI